MIPRFILELWEWPLKNGVIIHNRYKITSFIGKGSYGLVYQAMDEVTSEKVVVKQLRNRKRKSNQELLIREARMLDSLTHFQTPKLIEYLQQDQKYFLVMEHKKGKNFEDLIIQEGQVYDERECIKILLKVLEVVKHLHNKHIIHRDLRLPNILQDGDQIYIIDFGLALFENVQASVSEVPTSLEKRLFREVTVKSDFYALGHFILFLLYSSYQATSKKERSWEDELSIDPRLKGVIKRMLQLEECYEDVNEITQDLESIVYDTN